MMFLCVGLVIQFQDSVSFLVLVPAEQQNLFFIM